MNPLSRSESLLERVRKADIQKKIRQKRDVALYEVLHRLGKYDRRGKSIFASEWDVLIILDACRVDALSTVAAEYQFLPSSISSIRSVASTSKTWMDQTFTDEYAPAISQTAYVTANPYSRIQIDRNDIALADEVWDYGWDSDLGTVPPCHVTDRAISVAREHDPDRLLVHYMQPHFPSIPEPLGAEMDLDTFGNTMLSVWNRLWENDLDRSTAWESYIENLRYVLNDIRLLLNNINGSRVILTADHGNAFGEWGQYGHPTGVPIGVLRDVPWVETTASDEGRYTPSLNRQNESNEVQARLAALGYE